MFQLFKLFQSARIRATFGKQLLISRAESLGFICGGKEGLSSGSGELIQPSSGQPARPWPPMAATGHPRPPPRTSPLATRGQRASCVSWSGGGGFSEARPKPPAREGRTWALAPPSGGGRRSGATSRLATRAVSRTSECRGYWRSYRRCCRRRRPVRAAPRQLGHSRRRGAPEYGHELIMMDLELPPPGLPSQQVLPRPWEPRGGARTGAGE